MKELEWEAMVKQYHGLHESVAKTYYACHASSFGSHKTHGFYGMDRSTRCIWCNRSREDVLGKLPPELLTEYEKCMELHRRSGKK